jgi:hypothetical protein
MIMPILLFLAIGAFLALQVAKGTAAQALQAPPDQPALRGWSPLAAAEAIFPMPQAAEAAHLVGQSVVFEMWMPHAKCITPIQARFYGRIVGDDSNVALLRYAIQIGGLVAVTSGDVCLSQSDFPTPGVIARAVPFQSLVQVYGGAHPVGPISPEPGAPVVHPRLTCTGGVISDPKLAAEYALFASDPVKNSHLACDLVYRLRGEGPGCDTIADAVEEIIVATKTRCELVP